MDYVSVAEARGMSGLRLALSAGTPGPWTIAARALFDIRKVPFVPVFQEIMAPNEELVAWTGRRNAPVAVYNDEPAVDGWLEILMLAERLGSGPSLFPGDPLDRALAMGFSAEICGHGGFGWARRLTMTATSTIRLPAPQAAARDSMMSAYGSRPEAIGEAPRRVIGILRGLSAQLRRQREAGSDYLVGDRLSGCDVHWAAFSQMIEPLPHAACPMDAGMRTVYGNMSDELRAEADPLLIAHRDRIFERHIGLPLDL
jgi:glutathione S-transferase